MAQHFLLSARARTLSLVQVMRMSDAEAEATFMGLRWAAGVVCVHCGCPTVYECRRPSGALRKAHGEKIIAGWTMAGRP